MKENQTAMAEAMDFGEIIDLLTGAAKDLSGRLATTPSYAGKNIARATSDLVLTFPVIADESVPVKTASMITRAIEKKAVAMLQILFGAIMVTNNKDVFDLIHKVHTNISSDDIAEIMDRIEDGYYDSYGESYISKEAYDAINEANKAIDEAPEYNRSFKRSLNESYVVDQYGAIVEADDYKQPWSKTNRRYMDAAVSNGEIKKANELQPTLLTIKFRGPNSNSDEVYSAVVGVKAKLQYVKTADMIDRIVTKNKDRHGLFDLIRATTKEIAFFKDFIFAIDKAKLDAISRKNATSPIWKILERRALRAKAGRFFGGNNAAAISTLLISANTADVLMKDYNVNVYRPSDILEIMDAYNIMAFFIADDINERCVYLYDDGSRQYERLSYSDLKKDKDSDLKKVITLLAKTR